MSEKFILTVKELHFGHIKETFGAGVVIEHDAASKLLIIDGRKFEDARDLDILKRQAAKFPDRPWIVPFSEEKLAEILSSKPVRAETPKKPRPGENMKVVKSDEDLTEPIDIRDTQISKRNNEAKEAARRKVKSDKLEIIRGDETVEERIAALKDKTDMNSMAERTRLKAAAPAKLPIVKDDSLGSGVSKREVPLNAGQSLPSREAIEAKTEEAKAIADERKKEADEKRSHKDAEEKQVAVLSEPIVGVEVGDNDIDLDKDAEIASLKAKIATLEAKNEKPVAVRRPVLSEQAKNAAGE